MGALDGKRIVVVGTDGALRSTAAIALEAAGASVAVVDVSHDGDTTAGVEAAIGNLGGLDVLANLTVPTQTPTASAEVTRTQWEQVFKATVRAARTSNQAAFRHMSANGGGLVVNHADQSAEFGLPGQALASASQQAVVALSGASAGAWHGSGVGMTVLQPGVFSDPATSVVPTLVFLASGAAPLHGRTVPC